MATSMLVENYGRLSRRIVLSYSADKPIEKFSRRFSISSPISILKKSDRISAFYYFPGDFAKDREKEIFLKQFKARMSEGLWTAYTDSRAEPELSYFTNLLDIPSLIIEDSQLKNGTHYFSAKFDENYSTQVSEFLLDLIDRDGNFQIEEISENRGIQDLQRFIHPERSMWFIRIILTLPSYGNMGKFRIPPESVMEVKHISSNGDSRAVFYFSDDVESVLPKGFVRISDMDNVYEGPVKDQVLHSLMFYSSGIPLKTVSLFQRFQEDSILMEMVMDRWSSVVFLKCLNRVSRRFDGLKVAIDTVQEFKFQN